MYEFFYIKIKVEKKAQDKNQPSCGEWNQDENQLYKKCRFITKPCENYSLAL